MKQTLLLFVCLFVIPNTWAQIKPTAEPAISKLKRGTEIGREPETGERMITIYPNPTSGIINLSLSGFSGKKTTLSVVNVIGTVVYHELLPDVDGRYVKTIDLGKFAHGLYYVKLEADDYSEIRKVVLK